MSLSYSHVVYARDRWVQRVDAFDKLSMYFLMVWQDGRDELYRRFGIESYLMQCRSIGYGHDILA